MKRVCVITGGHWAAVMGGAQYQMKCLVDELVNRNQLEVIYLAREVNPHYSPQGYKIAQIAKPGRINRYGFFFDTRELLRILKKLRPDVIYQRGLQSYTGISAYYAKKWNSRFIFHIAHDYDVAPALFAQFSPREYLKLLEKKIGEYGLRNANSIVAQSRHQGELLKKNYGRTPDIVIPNFHPIPSEHIEKPIEPIRVVWIANFKPTKRPEMFIRLAEDLQYLGDVEFIMIGRSGGSIYNNLHSKISGQTNLKYLGEQPIDEVNRILSSSHIFVNTSIAEGFPNTFIQAWMRKVPVVSACVDIDDVLKDEQIGFCDGTYEGLKSSVELLIRDNGLRQAIGERAHQYALSRHSLGNVSKLIELIETCMQ